MGKLFLLFAILPIVEISLLINIGQVIGGWNTVAVVVLTAMLGAYLVRQQGLSTLLQAQQKMQSGQIPGLEMAEGLLLVMAGVLLVTPGFITDIAGLLLCLPLTRPLIAKTLLKTLSVKVMQAGHNQGNYTQYTWQQGDDKTQQGDIIEGEYVKQDDKPSSLNKPD